MATVKVIEPHAIQPERLRVAAYCRVSSDSKDQLHSYAAQIRNYTEEIAQHDGWELADVYADEGLTGTRMDQRDDFNRMMRDCRKGKIDRILVKSVSRFAGIPETACPPCGSYPPWASASGLKKKISTRKRSPPN